jgi:hypothetical protein
MARIALAGYEVLTLEAVPWIVACLLLPAGWGWLAHWLFVKLGLYRRLPGPSATTPGNVDTASTWDYQI